MALVTGTNCGFVTEAPSADPAAANITIDGAGIALRDTVPATAAKIVEIGFWVDSATEAANCRAALYNDDGAVVPGEAGTRLFLSNDVAKGTDAGWKKITVNWDIAAYQGTTLWIGTGLDNTATASPGNYSSSGGPGWDSRSGATMPDPFGGGAIYDADANFAIYAVWEAAAAAGGHPAIRRFGGIPGCRPGMQNVWRGLLKDFRDYLLNPKGVFVPRRLIHG